MIARRVVYRKPERLSAKKNRVTAGLPFFFVISIAAKKCYFLRDIFVSTPVLDGYERVDRTSSIVYAYVTSDTKSRKYFIKFNILLPSKRKYYRFTEIIFR